MDATATKSRLEVYVAETGGIDESSRTSCSPRSSEPFSKQTATPGSPNSPYKARSGKLLPRGTVDLTPLYHNLLGPSFSHKLKPLATSISSTAGSLQYDKQQALPDQISPRPRHRPPAKTNSVANLRTSSVTNISQNLNGKYGKSFTSGALIKDESGLFNLQALTKVSRGPGARRRSALLHSEMQDLAAAADIMDHYYGLNDEGHALAMKPINSLAWDAPTNKGTSRTLGSVHALSASLPGAVSDEPCLDTTSTPATPRPPSARRPSTGRGRLVPSRRPSEVSLDKLKNTTSTQRSTCDLGAAEQTTAAMSAKLNAVGQLPSTEPQSLARKSVPTPGKRSASLVDSLLGKFRQLLSSS